ncbi:hypothetical protein D3C86_1760330 [compost metagenome]
MTVQVQRPRTRDATVPPSTFVTLRGGFRQGVNSIPARIGGWSKSARLKDGEPSRISLMGAEIEILGVDEGNVVRYRVLSATPTQVERVTMGITTRTTMVPIFIPG